MKILTTLMMIGLGLTAASLVPPAAAIPGLRQDEDPPAESGPSLEERVEALERENAGIKAELKAHQEQLTRTYNWLRLLPAAADALDAKMDQARRDGFEAAGPNPRSKKAVLDALKDFATAMKTENPALPKNPSKK